MSGPAIQAVTSQLLCGGRLEGRASWGQRSRPGPFLGGGGKWKHDGFEELQQQLDSDAKAAAVPGVAVVAGLQAAAAPAPVAGKSMLAST